MAKARPSNLEQAAIALAALLAAVDSAVRGVFHRGKSDDSLEQDKAKSGSRYWLCADHGMGIREGRI